MFSQEVNERSLWAWIFTGMTAPVAFFSGNGSWLSTLLAGLICTALCICVLSVEGAGNCNAKWYHVLQLLWLGFVAGQIARWGAECWPTGNGFPVVPLTLLVLAVFAAWDGGARAAGAGSVVFWLLALLYALILVAGVGDVKAEYLKPVWRLPDAAVVMVYLLPAVAVLIPASKKRSVRWLAAVLAFGVVTALWTVGTLSEAVSSRTSLPFYEFSKSLSLFGVAERIEAFVSVAMTMGFFALLSFLCSAAGHAVHRAYTGKGKWGVVAAGTVGAASMWFEVEYTGIILAAGSVLLWCAAPILCGIKKGKIPKKHLDKQG